MTVEEYEKALHDSEELIEKARAADLGYDLDKIRKGCESCLRYHGEQRRYSGDPYYTHPFAVAAILIELGMDTDSLVAALLHDTVEDTEATLEELRHDFGNEVATLVDGVTKLGKVPISTRESAQAENLRKMLLAMAEDIRVIIIKLADRLHNMRTSEGWRPQKQRDKALETLEIYAPIAHRLGIRGVKEELEDRAIQILDPVAYAEIEESLAIRRQDREQFLAGIQERIRARAVEYVPDIYIEGRVKSIHGIYRKMYMKGKAFEEIYDIYAVRVITNSVADCYNILGVMHDMFQPIPGRFKDYISTPKPNMYQSLHTTVIDREGVPFEIQIRTWEMHHTAEYGIAAHWKYKEGIKNNEEKLEQRLAWIRQIIETQRDSDDAEDIMQSIKIDLAQDDVFAVTPKGDVISLPVGSTVVDFAYTIHSAVGNKMVGAKVDGRIVPLTHEVKTGEIIEILTTNQPGHGPSRDWINFARTSQAKQKIRNWFKKERRPENIATGKLEVEREFARNGIRLPEAEMQAFLSDVAKRQKYASVEEFYAAIGYGGLSLFKIIPRIKEDFQRMQREKTPPTLEDIVKKPKFSRSSEGVVIEGIDNCLIKLSRCCTPLPGDPIVGFITRGHGVSIHKRDCCNVPADLHNCEEPERWIEAYWANEHTESFQASLEILTVDRNGMLADVTVALANMHVGIASVNARTTRDGKSLMDLTVMIESAEHLKNICLKLQKVNGVISVDRVSR